MAYSDIKHDDNMEAGLLSSHEEEERMLLKEALYQDEDPEPYMEPAQRNSPTKRILMALGICFLVGIAVVSIGSATGVCPGHMRHTAPTEISVKDAVHRHNPNLSHAMGHMARRQNTPSASETQATQTQQTQATEPTTSEAVTSEAPDSETSEAATTTEEAPSTTAETETQATTEEAQSSEEAASSTDSGEQTSESIESTITEGTRTTSSAVATRTFTSTRPDGGITTLTSTSWVAVVPQATSTSNPNLQNAAPSQHSVQGVLTAAIGMIFGGLLLL